MKRFTQERIAKFFLILFGAFLTLSILATFFKYIVLEDYEIYLPEEEIVTE